MKGGELKCQFSPQGSRFLPSLLGRYKAEGWTAALSASHMGIVEVSPSCFESESVAPANILRPHTLAKSALRCFPSPSSLTPQVAVATQLDINGLQQEASAGISAVYRLRSSTIYTQVSYGFIFLTIDQLKRHCLCRHGASAGGGCQV